MCYEKNVKNVKGTTEDLFKGNTILFELRVEITGHSHA